MVENTVALQCYIRCYRGAMDGTIPTDYYGALIYI